MPLLRSEQTNISGSSGISGSFVSLPIFNSFTGSYNTGSFLGSFLGSLTGSSLVVNGPVIINKSGSSDIFLIQSGSLPYLKVNSQGILVLNPMNTTPSPVSGGVYFNSSGDVFVGL